MKTIETLFDTILESELFRFPAPTIDLPVACTELAMLIKETETAESVWNLGECQECTLGDFIIGAYWSLTEWHAGQWSYEYTALCALGTVFKPGMTSGPEDGTSEQIAYDACCAWLQRHADSTGRGVA